MPTTTYDDCAGEMSDLKKKKKQDIKRPRTKA